MALWTTRTARAAQTLDSRELLDLTEQGADSSPVQARPYRVNGTNYVNRRNSREERVDLGNRAHEPTTYVSDRKLRG